MKKKIGEYGIYIAKTVYYEVSCGVLVGWVLKATWTGVPILQVCCVCGLCELPPMFQPPLLPADEPDFNKTRGQ
jgi:hypothetical protein